MLSHSPKSSLSLSSTSKGGHNSHCCSLVSLNELRDRSITSSSVMGKEGGNCDFMEGLYRRRKLWQMIKGFEAIVVE